MFGDCDDVGPLCACAMSPVSVVEPPPQAISVREASATPTIPRVDFIDPPLEINRSLLLPARLSLLLAGPGGNRRAVHHNLMNAYRQCVGVHQHSPARARPVGIRLGPPIRAEPAPPRQHPLEIAAARTHRSRHATPPRPRQTRSSPQPAARMKRRCAARKARRPRESAVYARSRVAREARARPVARLDQLHAHVELLELVRERRSEPFDGHLARGVHRHQRHRRQRRA